MSKLKDQERERLEAELLATMAAASRRVLACAVLDRLIRFGRLPNSRLTAGAAAFVVAVCVWVLAWTVDRMVGYPTRAAEAGLLIIPASFGGLALWVVKTVHEAVFPPNYLTIASLPAEQEGFAALGRCFERTFRVWRQTFVCVGIGLTGACSLRVLLTSFPEVRDNVGLYLGTFLAMFAAGDGWYFALALPSLASVASRHRLNLYPYDPGSSLALRKATGIIARLVLGTGFAASLVMVFIFVVHPWAGRATLIVGFSWLLFSWGAVTYIFALPSYHIAKAIAQEKQIQLERLDPIIERYHVRICHLSGADLDKLHMLVELRDRIAKSRNSPIGLAAWRDYTGSLALPLLSFVMGAADLPRLLSSVTFP